jgi:hypothetical protein
LPTFGARLLLTSLQPAYLSTQIALTGGGVPDWTEESIPRVGLGFSVVIPRTWGLHHLPGPLIRAQHPHPSRQQRLVVCGSRSPAPPDSAAFCVIVWPFGMGILSALAVLFVVRASYSFQWHQLPLEYAAGIAIGRLSWPYSPRFFSPRARGRAHSRAYVHSGNCETRGAARFVDSRSLLGCGLDPADDAVDVALTGGNGRG